MSSEKIAKLSDRVKLIREHLGISQAEIAKKLGITAPYVSELESGRKRNISRAIAKLFQYEFRINSEWLLKGTGEPFLTSWATPSAFASSNIVHIPLYNVEASAGDGSIPIDENVREYIPLKIAWLKAELRAGISGVLAVPVRGDSMHPTIDDGDLVLIEKTSEIRDDAIYVFRRGDVVQVKRLQALPGGRFRVISDNKERYESYTVDPAEYPEYSVIGRVVWHGRNL